MVLTWPLSQDVTHLTGCVCVCVCVYVLSHVQVFAALWTVTHQALSMEFSKQEYWSRLLFPTQGDLLHPGIKPA